jgi:hypothetical protein
MCTDPQQELSPCLGIISDFQESTIWSEWLPFILKRNDPQG